MERMRTLSNDRDRDETGAAPPEDEPVADVDFDAWVMILRRGRFDAC